jgi:YVTN family beta-propeller protein
MKRITFFFATLMFVAFFCLRGQCEAAAYVANNAEDTVSVIRIPDNSIIKTIPVGKGPYGVAENPTGAYVYVTNNFNNTVSVISTSDNTVSGTIAVGKGPLGIAVSSDGYSVYVANNLDSTVSILNASSNTVATTVAVGNNPRGIAVTPNNDYVYVANTHDNTVSVIRTSDNTVASTVSVGNNPQGIAVSPDGGYVYVANTLDNTVSIISTSDNTVSGTIAVGSGPLGLAVSPYGYSVYVANTLDNTVSVISGSTFTLSATISVGNGPSGVALTFRKYLYITNNLDNTVSVITTADNAVVATIAVGKAPIALGKFIGGQRLAPPSSLAATVQSYDQIDLSWTNQSADAWGVVLESKQGSAGIYGQLADLSPDVTTYSDTNLQEYRTYYYRLAAYTDVPSYSAEVSATTDKYETKVCAVATALYDSPFASFLKDLREFRDRFLLTSSAGRFFVDLYYANSPSVAGFLREHNTLRAVVRWGLVPIGAMSWVALRLDMMTTLVIMVLLLVLGGATIFVAMRKLR